MLFKNNALGYRFFESFFEFNLNAHFKRPAITKLTGFL